MPMFRMSDALNELRGKRVVLRTIYQSEYMGIMRQAGDYIVRLENGNHLELLVRRDLIEACQVVGGE